MACGGVRVRIPRPFYGYQKVPGILENGDGAGFLLSAEDGGTETEDLKLPRHKNIRGSEYFSKTTLSDNLKHDGNEDKRRTAPILAEKDCNAVSF